MGIKIYRYKKDKVESVAKVIGTEEFEEQVRVCDGCGKYLGVYKELIGGPFSSKETGRISPCEGEFDSKTWSSVTYFKCDQCGKLFCEDCLTASYICSIYDDMNDEHIGRLFLCESCIENPNVLSQKLLYGIFENEQISDSLCENLGNLRNLFMELEDVLDN